MKSEMELLDAMRNYAATSLVGMRGPTLEQHQKRQLFCDHPAGVAKALLSFAGLLKV